MDGRPQAPWRFNPAVRALYARVVAKNPDRKAIAIGHAMRKLLHLVFAVWKTKKPFDKTHYRWDTPGVMWMLLAELTSVPAPSAQQETAGLTLTAEPARKEVTAVSAVSLAHEAALSQDAFLDFAHVKKQLPMTRVFEHLGIAGRLKGPGPQKRAARVRSIAPERTRPHVQRQRA